jgi:hypothetical protein
MHYRIAQADLESVWTHWGVDPGRRGHPSPMEPPPFKWGDRYDLIGLAVAAGLVAALLLADVSLGLTIVFGCAALNLTAYALRRRAGIPQVTLWQRMRRARR